jgi:hypothetical protein
MTQRPVNDDLERRVRALELALSATEPRPRPRRRSPIRRVIAVVASMIIIAGLPMITVASDRFADVGNSNPFHDEINELFRARITKGCATNPRRYCPDAPVTRGQMAGFLTRGLGRVTWDAGTPMAGASPGCLASVTVDAGGLPGGTGYVLVNATVTASQELAPDQEAPPTSILFAVRRILDGPPCQDVQANDVHWNGAFNFFGPWAPSRFPSGPDDGYALASGSTSEVLIVPSGEPTIIELRVTRASTAPTATIDLSGEMTALYVPFGDPPAP